MLQRKSCCKKAIQSLAFPEISLIPSDLNNYYHLPFDLSEASRMSQIMDKVNEIIGNQVFPFVCLLNNASAVELIDLIERCLANDIESHVELGLLAPMLLPSIFIQRFTT